LQLPAELDEMQMESNMLFGEGMSELAVNLTEVDAAEQDKATKAYQDAYSLILDEKWPQAQKAFHDFVRQYPKNRYTDAAQFWYCYGYEKAGKSPEKAFDLYDQFIKTYPRSKWTDDAKANTGLTEIMFNNLFLNAIQHNIQNGEIHIHISEQKLTISNSGQSQSLRQEKLFNRFAKNKPSDKGNGLGLAIVKKITELNSWKVSYNFSNNHHIFSVQF